MLDICYYCFVINHITYPEEDNLMKTAAKVFIILGMICGFWTILPLIFGIIALKKLKTATKKEELTTSAVLTLLFCNLIGGILMLCLKDEDLAPAEQ